MSGLSNFLFCVCQTGAEPAVKHEVAALRPDLRFAYSRPGLLTFKAPAPVSPDTPLPAVFVRAWGASLGPRCSRPSPPPVLPASPYACTCGSAT